MVTILTKTLIFYKYSDSEQGIGCDDLGFGGWGL